MISTSKLQVCTGLKCCLIGQQFSETQVALALTQSEQQRTTKRLNAQLSLAIDPQVHDDVTRQLRDAEQRSQDLERALTERTEETNKLITGLKADTRTFELY